MASSPTVVSVNIIFRMTTPFRVSRADGVAGTFSRVSAGLRSCTIHVARAGSRADRDHHEDEMKPAEGLDILATLSLDSPIAERGGRWTHR
jgi:hypothetical protein